MTSFAHISTMPSFNLLTGFGLIRSNYIDYIDSGFQFTLYRITNGELITYTNEQIPKLSVLKCAIACAKRNGWMSLIFDSEGGQCSLLSRGLHQNSLKPEILDHIKAYTRSKTILHKQIMDLHHYMYGVHCTTTKFNKCKWLEDTVFDKTI